MSAQVLVFLRWLAYLLFALTLIPIGLALAEFTKARRAAYYAVRRAAFSRATRWLLVSAVLPSVAIVLLLVPSFVAYVLPSPPTVTPLLTSTPTPTPVPVPSETPITTPTATRRPTATPPQIPTITPTRRPTATPPPIPTPTPTVRPPDTALTPIPSALPAREDSRIQLLALATQVDADGLPVDPGKEFPPGHHLVYLFFQHEGMDAGVPVTVAWYQEGELLEVCSGTWLWDLVEGRVWGEQGQASVTCHPIAGWQQGNYEIRVFIETRLEGIAQFVIK